MAVDFAVSEDKISRFEDLLHKRTDGRDSTFTLQLSDESIYSYPGKLLLLDRAVDPETGTITARLVFPNPKDYLKPGMTCNVKILNTTNSNQILIPYKAVTEQMGEYFVFVAQNGHAIQKRVQLGINIGGNVIVKNGLNLGDKIIIEGIQRLRENSPIMIAAAVNQSPNQTALK